MSEAGRYGVGLGPRYHRLDCWVLKKCESPEVWTAAEVAMSRRVEHWDTHYRRAERLRPCKFCAPEDVSHAMPPRRAKRPR